MRIETDATCECLDRSRQRRVWIIAQLRDVRRPHKCGLWRNSVARGDHKSADYGATQWSAGTAGEEEKAH